MKLRQMVTYLAGILVIPLSACVGESVNVATGVNSPAATADVPENVTSGPAGENIETQNSGDIDLLEIQISPEYEGDSIVENTLAATHNGAHWAALWVTEQDNDYTLHAAAEIEGIWQSPFSLTTGYRDSELKSSDSQIMVAWTDRKTESGNTRRNTLQARVLDNKQWLPVDELDSVVTDTTAHEIKDTAMTAMSADRFALLWTKQEISGSYSRQIIEWNTDHWTESQTLPPIDVETRSNQLVATADNSLSNLYSRTIRYEDDSSEASYWIQDRIAGTWQTPVRIDQVEIPLWLTRTSLQLRAMSSSSSGKQIVAWATGLSDTFGTRYYGVVSVMRDAPGQPWSSHFELTGNELITDLQVAITDSGHAAIGWLRQTGPSRHQLMLSRYTPDTGWLAIESNVMQPGHFPDLPPDPATYYPATDRITMQSTGNRIRLSLVTEVGYIQTGSYYYSLQSGDIGFEQQAITNAIESSRAYRQQLLSCDSRNDRYRCSRSTAQLNLRATSPSRLMTEQIEVIDID